MKKYLNRTILYSAIAGLSLLGVMGCDEAINSDYEEQISVTAFLMEGSPIDSVVVEMTTPFGTYYNADGRMVDGADVRVTVDGVTHQLVAGTANGPRQGRYCLPASELIIQAGKTYQLSVATSDGKHHLTAETKVPQPIRFTGIIDSLRRQAAGRLDTLTLDTTNFGQFFLPVTAAPLPGGFAEPSQKYILQVVSYDSTMKINTPTAGPPTDTSAFTRFSFTQTAPLIPIGARLFGAFGRNRIAMLAIDTNFVDWFRQIQSGRFLGYQPSLNHISGGLGVWASAARDTFQIYIRPKQ